MIILYILLVAYILAINFYAFLLVKSLKEKETQKEITQQAAPLSLSQNTPTENANNTQPTERYIGKLCITGALGGAITIYICMFLLKFKRSDLLLMVVMPLLGVLNVYLWVLLFRSGFGFLIIK